jgi:hypothetical protein
MRVETRGYRQGNAASRGPMARRAAKLAQVEMTRVIELHAKTLQTWKRFQRS